MDLSRAQADWIPAATWCAAPPSSWLCCLRLLPITSCARSASSSPSHCAAPPMACEHRRRWPVCRRRSEWHGEAGGEGELAPSRAELGELAGPLHLRGSSGPPGPPASNSGESGRRRQSSGFGMAGGEGRARGTGAEPGRAPPRPRPQLRELAARRPRLASPRLHCERPARARAEGAEGEEWRRRWGRLASPPLRDGGSKGGRMGPREQA